MTKEERLEWIKRGRDVNRKFGEPREKLGGSSTNKEKKRSKPFMLVKQSKAVREKQKLSVRQKNAKKRAGQKKYKGKTKKGRK